MTDLPRPASRFGEIPLVGPDDGGLAMRQVLRGIKDRMDSKDFRVTAKLKMKCGECIKRNLRNVRGFRTWSALRDHLIGYHDMDHREVPE